MIFCSVSGTNIALERIFCSVSGTNIALERIFCCFWYKSSLFDTKKDIGEIYTTLYQYPLTYAELGGGGGGRGWLPKRLSPTVGLQSGIPVFPTKAKPNSIVVTFSRGSSSGPPRLRTECH